MKRYFIIIAASVMALCSCATTSLPQKMDSFVDEAELKSESYTAEDWQKSKDSFDALINQFNASDASQYSDAEKEMAARAMGRYHALMLRQGVEKTEDILGSIGKILPEYLDGFATELENGVEGFADQLKSLVDTSALNSSFEKLGAALEGVFGAFGDAIEGLGESINLDALGKILNNFDEETLEKLDEAAKNLDEESLKKLEDAAKNLDGETLEKLDSAIFNNLNIGGGDQ